MKKIILLSGLALSLCTSFKTEAQVRVNIQLGVPVTQQRWYNNDDDYYYMPEHGVYYNVRRQCYVYPEGGSWVYANSLPARYGGYTWSSSRYYRLRERAPFNRNDYYRRQYPVAYNGGYGRNYGRQDNGNHRGWGRNGNTQGNRDNRDQDNGNNGGGNWNNNNGGGRDGGNSNHYNRR